MAALEAIFWTSAGALAWTHIVYPIAARVGAAVRTRAVRADDSHLPSVAIIIAAYNEESVIARRLENLRSLDYPPGKLEIVVTSDASSDRTEALAEAAGARVIRNSRGGKVAAQNNAVRQTDSEIIAFSDANCTWASDALRKLVRNFADPDVAYVCGRLNITNDDGRNKEGVYWRYELALRADESRIDSVTGGNGSIYGLRRSDYVEVDSRFGHDLALPYLMVQRGRRAVYEREAHAYEKATPTNEDEYRRKVRMFEHCWAIVVEGKMLRRLRPLYFVEIVSHRHLRYASGVLHLVALGTNVALLGHGTLYAVTLGLQLGVLLAAAVGVRIARYYVLVSWATVVALWNYARRGVPATWDAAEGTR
ncbi:MAG TPA: glycosyltransferase family 2 protein [Gaiellaceae bacterium]|jgi:cellulose synthase/poly-beta-1,6-N-acetylglucosamine synthase-like glycosyltransferase